MKRRWMTVARGLLPLGLGLCLTACLGTGDDGEATGPSTPVADPAASSELRDVGSAPRGDHFGPAPNADVRQAVTLIQGPVDEVGSMENARGVFDPAVLRTTEIFLARKGLQR